MYQLLTSYKAQVIFFSIALMISLVFSAEAVTSISMIGFLLLAIFERQPEKGTFPRLRNTFKDNCLQLWEKKAYFAVMIPFFLVLATATYSVDVDYTLERLRIKLPLLIFPFAFISMPHLKKKDYYGLLYFFFLLMTIAGIGVGINYGLHQVEINQALTQGKHVPTPINHIRFSLMLAFSILIGAYLFREKYKWKFAWETYLIGGLTIFLLGLIHLLSVRSGILALYLSIFVWSFRYARYLKKPIISISIGLFLLVLPYLVYLTVPSFRYKINYSLHDLDMAWQGRGAKFSDGERIASLHVGWLIGKANPLLGVGAGDLKQSMYELYPKIYPDRIPRMPHNQFMSLFAGVGLIGLVIFLIAFWMPWWRHQNYKDHLFAVFGVIIFFSFFVENTIENAVGVAFYVFFLLLMMHYLEGVAEERNTQ